jgi:hypothetical protein
VVGLRRRGELGLAVVAGFGVGERVLSVVFLPA